MTKTTAIATCSACLARSILLSQSLSAFSTAESGSSGNSLRSLSTSSSSISIMLRATPPRTNRNRSPQAFQGSPQIRER
jgi:hypothetical protein